MPSRGQIYPLETPFTLERMKIAIGEFFLGADWPRVWKKSYFESNASDSIGSHFNGIINKFTFASRATRTMTGLRGKGVG